VKRAPLALALAATVLAATPGGAADGGAPGFVVMDLAAIKRALRGSRGHVVLVHFWATWCSPCLEELPLMEKFARDMRPRGVEILSLSLDDPERAGGRVSKVLAEVAPSLTRSIARVDDMDAFIGNFRSWEGAIPALFAYDSEGQLRGSLIGETNRHELDELVARLARPRPRPR
jgi:thiol-disulfide isomerase/thioredoxin